MSFISLLGITFIALSMVQPANAQMESTTQPSIALPGDLDRILRDYESAWMNGDEEALATLFVDEGYVSGQQGWIKGHEQIRAKYEGASGDLRLRAISYAVEGATGYILGAYGYGTDESFTDWGIFVLAIQKAPSGKWLIVADLDRSNQ